MVLRLVGPRVAKHSTLPAATLVVRPRVVVVSATKTR